MTTATIRIGGTALVLAGCVLAYQSPAHGAGLGGFSAPDIPVWLVGDYGEHGLPGSGYGDEGGEHGGEGGNGGNGGDGGGGNAGGGGGSPGTPSSPGDSASPEPTPSQPDTTVSSSETEPAPGGEGSNDPEPELPGALPSDAVTASVGPICGEYEVNGLILLGRWDNVLQAPPLIAVRECRGY